MAVEILERKTALQVRLDTPKQRKTYILSGNNITEWEEYLRMLEKLTEESRKEYEEALAIIRWAKGCHAEVAGVVEDGSSLIFTFLFENPYNAAEFERGLPLSLSD